MTPRILIASPSANAWSETFIAAHMERLQGVEVIITDGLLPTRVHKGPVLLAAEGSSRLKDQVIAKLKGTNTEGLLRERIAGLLRKERIDVVLAEYGTCAHALIGPCRAAGVPLVAHFHGFDAHKKSAIAETGEYKELFSSAAAIVVVSRVMEQQLLSLGASRERLHYNCYGIDVDRFTPGDASSSSPHFVAVGRFVEKKAPQLTISAFARVAERIPDVKLTMIGQGPLWESCFRLVQALGLEGRVEMPGIMKPEEIAGLMRSSRAFVQHSIEALSGDREGTPLAVLEAMASGIPVIATRHAGIADVVVHEEHGLLCDEFDVETMAANLVRVANDASLAGRMGKAGRDRVEKHHRVQDSVAVLQRIINAAAGKG